MWHLTETEHHSALGRKEVPAGPQRREPGGLMLSEGRQPQKDEHGATHR